MGIKSVFGTSNPIAKDIIRQGQIKSRHDFGYRFNVKIKRQDGSIKNIKGVDVYQLAKIADTAMYHYNDRIEKVWQIESDGSLTDVTDNFYANIKGDRIQY